MNDKFVELLKGQIDKLKNIAKPDQVNVFHDPSIYYDSTEVEAWISSAISILERIFGKESLKIVELEKIMDKKFFDLSAGTYYQAKDVCSIGTSILQACIDEIVHLGRPPTIYDGKSGEINLNVVQNQSNVQTVNLEIITKALQDELTGTQLNEIQELLNSQDEKEIKNKKLIEKLKEFGINTLSGIISGVLTSLTHRV